MGHITGAVLAFWLAIEPTLPAYLAVILVGLLGAAAPALPRGVMQCVYLVVGVVLTNAILSGHTLSEIPPFAFLGIAFALNVAAAAAARLVFVSLQLLNYGWVLIAWRAGMSWIVAIAIMAMVLVLSDGS